MVNKESIGIDNDLTKDRNMNTFKTYCKRRKSGARFPDRKANNRLCACHCIAGNVLRHESESSLFLSTGCHPALVPTPRESCSAQPGQSSDLPNLPPHTKLLRFSFLSLVLGECPPKHRLDQGSEGSFNMHAVKVEDPFCLLSRRALAKSRYLVYCIVLCSRVY